MAYNKDNYEHNRLTPKQEKFVDGILAGKTQTDAYLEAYPSASKWERKVVWIRASDLMKNSKVQVRLQELGYANHEKATWTRQKALETINYVMDMNKKEMARLDAAYQDEIDILEAKLMELTASAQTMKTPDQMYKLGKQMQDITGQIAKVKKQRRTYDVNVKGIFEGAKILNRMFGYDIQKVEVKQADEDKEELNKLSAEELKKVLAMNK